MNYSSDFFSLTMKLQENPLAQVHPHEILMAWREVGSVSVINFMVCYLWF